MQSVYVAGVGMTKFGKDPRPLAEIFCQAAKLALGAAELDRIDALYIGVMNPEEFTGDSNIASLIADAIGLTGIPALRIETASSAGAAALMAGFQAIASGYYRRVLVLGGEKMTHLTTSAATRILAGVIDKRERQCGATMPALAAMMTEKYRQKSRISESRLSNMLCGVALKNHANGAHNPLAQFQRAIKREAYFASKFVATPLRLYDCAPITDGAAGVVLTSEKTDVCLSGIGQGTGTLSLQDREVFTSFPATKVAAARAYRMADVSAQNIDFAEVHDAFTPFEIISTEDLGFFPPGKGGDAVLDGKTALAGTLPVNLSGGLKARGHPVGASGLAQVVEVSKRYVAKLGRNANSNAAWRKARAGSARIISSRSCNGPTPRRCKIYGRSAGSENGANHKAVAAPPVQQADEGVIETFTILYVTPDGFLPPLALALIRTPEGRLLMAQGEDESQLKIGQEVYLRRIDGVCLFTVKGQIQKVQDAFMKLFRRKAATPAPKDNRKEAPK